MKWVLGLCILCGCALDATAQIAPSPSGQPSQQELDQAVDEGVQYLQQQAELNLQAARTLQTAINSGNVTGLAESSAFALRL